ncbi:hypothetical protein D3C80_1623680 [compost metagenome]
MPSGLNILISFANITPPNVSKMKATNPKPMIISVSNFTNRSAVMVLAILIPNKMVTRLANSFCAERDSLFNTPHSRIRFPNIRNPISAIDEGAIIPAMSVTIIGKRIRAVRETGFD